MAVREELGELVEQPKNAGLGRTADLYRTAHSEFSLRADQFDPRSRSTLLQYCGYYSLGISDCATK